MVELTSGMERGPSAGKASDVWAVAPWIAVALTPVGFIVAGLWIFGASFSEQGVNVGDWVVAGLLLLAAPTAAEMLAAHAVHAGHRGGEASAQLAGVLLMALLAFFAYGTTNAGGAYWLAVVVVFVAALGLPAFAWMHHPRRKAAGGDAQQVDHDVKASP